MAHHVTPMASYCFCPLHTVNCFVTCFSAFVANLFVCALREMMSWLFAVGAHDFWTICRNMSFILAAVTGGVSKLLRAIPSYVSLFSANVASIVRAFFSGVIFLVACSTLWAFHIAVSNYLAIVAIFV